MNTARRVLQEESSKKWIKCREGWVSYALSSGNRYLVTATNQGQRFVQASDLHHYVEDLVRKLGGRARG